MPKQLNVNMSFTADTSQAKRQLQDLQKELGKLGSESALKTNNFQFTDSIKEATIAVAKLKSQLQDATNPTTGLLDLGKFTESMDRSGMSLEKYRNQLVALGPDGKKAFLSLSQSIMNAETPLLRANSLLQQFGTTIMNAARWQASSSAIHAFMGAVQGAYGYAQDLDKSLNSIRIVSGQSKDAMAEFATQANKAAQSLSTSTLAYTDAALIFYQQGLSGDAVTERVDTVLKLSNVTGDSADQVSNYMTAIWNNFYDGSESLESFADKITALGAATASSSAEISAGLQQFAAIGNTVGLSYDYAATALATIVAQTRQSESTVGNGLRTIFARLSSLKQGGETEDGVDLTKYTAALDQVGVSVLDQNGQLKEMDEILDDIGSKWQTLSKNQQVALAQTVGGVRQYATLIALFDNWDQFQRNLDVTQNSEGALQEQADIYAQSWEGAQKRVKAAQQAIFQDLIDEDFFIEILNIIEKVLQGVDKFIDSIGGIKGVLLGIAAVATTVFSKQIGNLLDTTAYRLRSFTAAGQQYIKDQKTIATQLANEINFNDGTAEGETRTAVYTEINNLQKQLLDNEKNLTAEQQLQYRNYLDLLRASGEMLINESKKLDTIRQEREALSLQARRSAGKNWGKEQQEAWTGLNSVSKAFGVESSIYNNATKLFGAKETKVGDIKSSFEKFKANIKQDNIFEELSPTGQARINKLFATLQNKIDDLTQNKKDTDILNLEEELKKVEEIKKAIESIKGQSTDEWVEDTTGFDEQLEDVNPDIRNKTSDIAFEEGVTQTELAFKQGNIDNIGASMGSQINQAAKVSAVAQGLVQGAQAASQFALGINALGSGVDALLSKDLSPLEKMVQVLMSFGMAFPMMIKGLTGVITFFPAGAAAAQVYATSVEAGATKTVAFSAALKSLQSSAPLLLPLVAVIGTLIALYTAWDKVEQAKIAAQKEAADEAYNEISAKQELIETNNDLYDSYVDLYEQQQKGIDVADELAASAEKMADAYDLEGAAVAKLTGDYDKLTQQIRKKREEELRNQITDATENIEGQTIAMINAARKGVGQLDLGKKTYSWAAATAGTADAKFARETLGSNVLTVDVNDSESVIEYYEKLEQFKKDIKEAGYSVTSTLYSNVQEELSQMKDAYDKAIELQEITQDSYKELAELETDIASADTQEDFNERLAELKTFLENEGLSSEIINQIVSQILQELSGEGNWFATNELSQEAGYNQKLADADTSRMRSQETIDQIDSVQGQLSSGEKLNKKELEEQQEILYDLETKYAELGEIQDRTSYAYLSRLREIRELEEENVKIQLIQSLEAQEEQLTQLQNEMAEKAKMLANDSIPTSAKEGIQKALDEVMLQYDALVEEMESNEIKLKASIEADFDSDIDSAFGLAEQIDGLSEIIGDNLEITYAKAQEIIANGNGAILQNAKETANGTIELNKETVNAFIDSKQAEMEADRQAKIEQLESMKTVLESQKAAYQKKIESLKTALQATTAADAAEALAKAKLADQEIANNQTKLEAIMSDEKIADEAIAQDQSQLRDFIDLVDANIAENAGIAASAAAESSANLANASIGHAQKVANAWKAAWDAMKTGNFKGAFETVSGAITTGTYEGAEGPETLTLDEAHLTDLSNKILEAANENLAAIQAEAQLELEAAEKEMAAIDNQIGQLDAGIAALKSAGSSLDDYQKNLGSGKGSGSGGGGGKSRTEKEHKDLKEEEDRYHDIKSAIDQVQRSLDRLGKTKDRVYGKAKLKYLDQEISKLEERQKLENQYIDQIKGYLALDKAKLQSSVNGTLQIDSTGRLANYEEVLQNLVNDYNGAVNSYNSSVDAYNGGADESIMNTAEEYLKTAEKTYNKGKEALDQYEETYNLLQDELQNQIDLTWELYDLRLESITVAVDFELHWNERDLKYLDWLMKYIGDDATKGADKIANLAKQMDVYNESIEVAKQGIAGIFANHGISLDFNNLDPEQLDKALLDFMNTQNLESQLTQEEGEALEEYLQTLMDNYDGLYDSWKKAHEQVNASWDAWNERIERETDRLENYADELESIKDIIDLTGRNMLNLSTDDIDKMNQSIIENGWAQVESWKAVMEARKASMEQARYYMENAQTEEVREQWRESFEQFEDDYNEANKNYYSSWESTLKNVEKAFSETMDNLEKDYNKAMGDLTLVQEQFARKQEINHLYLDDYEKYHELNKSVDELRKSLENTNSTMMKSKMGDLLDEMNASMRDGVNISEAQAEIYARRVALLQAEAELLDAQNAKSAVRMTRDNEGNFSYTYTADQDQIDDAEANYQDKFYEVLSYERQYMEDIQGQMLDMTEQFWSDYYDLCERYKDDSAALEEAVEALIDDYNAKMDFLVAEQEMDMDEMARLRDDDWKDFENLTNKKLANQDDFIADFRSTIVGGLYPQYQTANQYAIEWQKTVERTTQAGNKAVDLYQTNTQHTFEVAGQNIDTYGQRAINKMNDIANQSQDTKQKVTDMAGEMQIDMSAIMSTAWSLDTAWGTVMNNMRNQIAQTVSALSQLLQRLQAVQAQAQATIAACAAAAQAQQVAALAGAGAGTGTTGNRGGNPGGNSTGTSTPGEWHITNTYESPGHADAMYWRWKDENDHSKGMESTRVRPPGFATGGYTGAWGPEGKIAMLHEKELVLNKEDTSNILNVVESVRDMVSNFGRNALNNLANAITNSGSLAMAGAGTLDQNVHIEASFPNVQSHAEIEMALNNLINSASQYVNRK